MKEEKPTREERLKTYELARDWLNERMDNQVGICTLLRRNLDSRYVMDVNKFPELVDEKPKEIDVNNYWFSSAKERIQVLTKIINKMKEEPLIKPGQQFKIDSIEELKEAYEKLSPWYYTLENEIEDFNEDNEYRWIAFDKGTHSLGVFIEDYETIPNPFKKSKWQRIKEILEDPECEKWEDDEEKDPFKRKIKLSDEDMELIDLVKRVKEDHELREELKALREEVEKLKELAKPQSIFDLGRPMPKEPIRNWMKEKSAKIMKEAAERILKNINEENPKESEELKIKHPSCELSLWKDEINNVVDMEMKTRDGVSVFCCQKTEAIKIVNYLKKHFEI